MKLRQVIVSETLIIKPSNMAKLNQETITKTGLTDQIIEEKGISF